MSGVEAIIGLGSNLDDPLNQVKQAVEGLAGLPQTELVRVSPYYQSEPMGPADQPDYINAVALIETTLSPRALLTECQKLENQQGRVRKERWGARTLDLDILTYGNETVHEPDLVIPHYGMKDRNFVLYPLQAMMGDTYHIPGLGTVAELVASCPAEGLKQLDNNAS